MYSNISSIREIPLDVGKLIHLRYLSFSEQNKIEKLPEALCELCNLQSLDIDGCYGLRELPQEIGKLINLRHLLNGETSGLSYMPTGIEKLNALRCYNQICCECKC